MSKHLGLGGALVAAVLLPAIAMAQPADRQALFGDLHLHTSFSFDAWAKYGLKITPEQAYRFARGEPIDYLGQAVRRAEPLDFMAVTDHAEYMGALNQLDDPNSAASQSEFGKKYRTNGRAGFAVIVEYNKRHEPVPGIPIEASLASAWGEQVAAANRNYVPGKFTTFIGYEWTSMWEGKFNLHRNIIFKGDQAPLPFTSQQSDNPEDLWTYLEATRARGQEVIAIPHNSNASGGLMFDWNALSGKPIERAYAERRQRNEPLIEIYQSKGQSETLPELSSADEFAGFEVFDQLLMAGFVRSEPNGSYMRQAHGRGLIIEKRTGINPFQLGVVGGTDFHNGLSTAAENAYGGDAGGVDPTAEPPSVERAREILTPRGPGSNLDLTTKGSGGLTGVWAERNDRDAIFAALQRRETFATSGTRIKTRLFVGWDYPRDLTRRAGWPATAYRDGVAMGGELAAAPKAGQRPRIAVWALKDPNGANLDRIQIVKLWLEGDEAKERVIDVAWSGTRKPDRRTGKVGAVGNTVDLKTAAWRNSIGATELQAVWEDTTFDPVSPAIYYARVLEIPTPRWSTLLAIARNLPLLTTTAPTIQERAWTSPVWYHPTSR